MSEDDYTADELMALVREVQERRVLTGSDGATERTDGRPIALDYAIVELLVEIRDLLTDKPRP